MLSGLSNTEIAVVGLGVQIACASVVFAFARWKWLAVFLASLPLFWAIPWLLASGHCLACLDGVVLLPIAFAAVVVCVAVVRRSDQAARRANNGRGDAGAS